METQFAPMKSLGYPSQEIVSKPAKDVNQQLADQRKKLEKDTGFGLSFKFDQHCNGLRTKSSRSRTRSSPNADGGGNSNTEETASRAEGWNISWMGVYGHVVERQQAFSPLKQPGAPFSNASANDRLLPHADTTYWPPPENELPRQDQRELVDLFYMHFYPPTPVLRRSVFEAELEKCINNEQSSFLSPFFFYSAFTIAAQFSDRLRETRQSFCMQQALAFRQVYFGYPCVSSIAALLMLSTFMERTKIHPFTNYSWALAGEAFTMVQDLGLHRMCNVSPNPADQELAARVFWVAFVCDRLLCVVTGRPFTFDEKDIDVTLPKLTEEERQDPGAEVYLRNFNCLIDISKVIGRVLRFNFSAQSADFRAPSLHQEAMLSTLDSWIASLMKESMVEKYPQGVVGIQRLFDIQKMLMLYCMLILLHQPYVDDVQTKPGYSRKSSETRPSFEICSASATIIIHTVYQLPLVDLEYLVNRSDSLYAILTATRLHLMNASCQHDAETVMNGEINFLRSMAVLEKLQTPPKSSLTQTINAFQERFDSRPDSILSDYAADLIRKEACAAQARTPFYLQFTPVLKAAGESSPTIDQADTIVFEQHVPTPQPSTERSAFNVSSSSSSSSSSNNNIRDNNNTSRPGAVGCKFIEFKKPPTKTSRKRRAGAPVTTTSTTAPTTPASSSSTVVSESSGYNGGGITMNQTTQHQQQYPSTTATVATDTPLVQQQSQPPLAFNSTFADIFVTMASEQQSLFDVAPFDNAHAMQMGIPTMSLTTSSTNNYVPPATTAATTSSNTSNEPQQSWMNMANGGRDDEEQIYLFREDWGLGVPTFGPLAQQQQQQQPLSLQHPQGQQQLPIQPSHEQQHMPLHQSHEQLLQQQQQHLLVQQQLQDQQQQQQQQQPAFPPPPATSGIDPHQLQPQMTTVAAPAMVSGFYPHHAWNQQPSIDVWEASSAST